MLRSFKELSVGDLFRFSLDGIERMMKKESSTTAKDTFTGTIREMNPDVIVDVLF